MNEAICNRKPRNNYHRTADKTMSKIRTVSHVGGQIFYCPGCEDPHAVNTVPNGPRWTYNGDPDSPTFSPSIKVTEMWWENKKQVADKVCHSFVKNGRIQFLPDCTHKMAGQTVDIPEWPYAPGTYGGIEEQ